MIEILFQNADVETSVIIKNEDTEDTYQYTFEKPTKWTPYNSNLHMHAMKVGDGSYCTGIELSQSSILAFAVEYYVIHISIWSLQVYVREPVPPQLAEDKFSSIDKAFFILDMVKEKAKNERKDSTNKKETSF